MLGIRNFNSVTILVIGCAFLASVVLLSIQKLPDPESIQSSVLDGMGINTCGCVAPEFQILLGSRAAEAFARREYWQRRCYNSLELCWQLTFEEWFNGVDHD